MPMIYAMDRATPIPCRGIAGEAETGRSVWGTSREQRKRRPEVYITEAQMAQVVKGPRPKARGGAPGVICPITAAVGERALD